MTSKSPARSCEDVDEQALSYAEIKALCAGNPHIKEKMQLDIEVAKLRLLQSEHRNQQFSLQDSINLRYPATLENIRGSIAGFKDDISRLETNTHKTEEGISPMSIGGKTYTDRGKAGAALLEACKSVTSSEAVKIGSYRGFAMCVSFDAYNKTFECTMKGSMTHTAELGSDSFGNITRINNALDKIPQRLMSSETHYRNTLDQVVNAKAELEKPFALESELTEKSARLAELDALLSADENSGAEKEADGEKPEREAGAEEDTEAAKAEPPQCRTLPEAGDKRKPSLLETLERNAAKSRAMLGGADDVKRETAL